MSDQPIIELVNANIYQRDNIILSNVTFSIGRGEFVYLIGKTGSGKSSLLRTLYAELPTYEGIVKVAGFDLTDIRRRKIPYLRRKLDPFVNHISEDDRIKAERWEKKKEKIKNKVQNES